VRGIGEPPRIAGAVGPGALVGHIYTSDPSAHVFDGKVYVFVSHDRDSGVAESVDGDQFDMIEYRLLSMDDVGGPVTDRGTILRKDDVPWAARQLWAPDAAAHAGTYYLYFPAKDRDGVFRIGVARAGSPEGPYVAEPRPIDNSFSIDPTVFKDDDGTFYMYFGGIRGGQLQRWRDGRYDPDGSEPGGDEPALGPRVARLRTDMLGFDEQVREVQVVDAENRPLRASDTDRRFFEAAWVHKFNGTYYLSYSTGETRFISYATGDSPYGPYTHRGVILQPVTGWTTHHSIVRIQEGWFLFYHDSVLSGGRTHLRNVKVLPLQHNSDGTIQTLDPYR